MLHHSLIIIIDHHHVFYNIFDHNWVSLSRARVEHEINISAEEKNFKKFNLREHDRFEIIWQKDLIILRSFDKKTWSFWSLHRSFDDTNATKQIQIKNETIKTNMRRVNQNEFETITNDNHWVENRLRRFKRTIREIVFDDLKIERSSFSCFYRVQMMWIITLNTSRMSSREDGMMYELNKQTNKQTNNQQSKSQ